MNRQGYRALVIDCGGSTEFGGNNLTYRVLQMLKLKIIESLSKQYELNAGRIRAQSIRGGLSAGGRNFADAI